MALLYKNTAEHIIISGELITHLNFLLFFSDLFSWIKTYNILLLNRIDFKFTSLQTHTHPTLTFFCAASVKKNS